MEQKAAPIYKGFLLTAHSEDGPKGHKISFYGKSDFGAFELVVTNERPLFFIESDANVSVDIRFQRKSLALKSFSGSAVDACYFEKQSDLYKLKDQPGLRSFESDIRSNERFLMERFIKGQIEFSGEFNENQGVRTFINPQIRAASRVNDFNFSCLSVDIETSRGQDLFSIGIHYYSDTREVKRVYMVGADQGTIENGELFYYPDERSCYEAFERDLQELDPDFILGWHVVGFDLVFLERKCAAWGIGLRLGRKNQKISISEKMGGNQFARIKGRVVIDGPIALRAAFYSFESWKLDSVSSELLGVNKDIEQTGLAKVAEIERRFKEDKPALAHYNLLDCVLVSDIIKKTGLIKLMKTRVELSGMLMNRLGASSASFDYFMLPQIHRRGFVAPNVVDISRDQHAAGGLVFSPKGGISHHVIVLDFKSLYPSIIRTFKIDPYSRLMGQSDPLKTPSGHKFSRSEHILPDFIEQLMSKRALAKEENDPYLSQAIKILMNSFYGVMGSGGSRFYHADLPSAITGTGQWILRETVEFFENDGLEVVYGDTDSIFVKLTSGERYADKAANLAQRANEHLTKVLRTHFNVDSELEIEFEKYFRKIFFPALRGTQEAAKKKYAGLLVTSESPEGELHFSGMEFVRSDWTKLAKNFQYELFESFFNDLEIEGAIRQKALDLKNGLFDKELVYKKRLSKDLSEYTKSVPPHVKAALLLKENNYPVERDVFYVYTRRGAVPIELEPDDFDYNHYIDKQIRPIAEILLSPLGMSFDNIVTGDQLSLF